MASKTTSYDPLRSDSMSNRVFLRQLMNKHGQFGDLYGNFNVIRKQATLISNGEPTGMQNMPLHTIRSTEERTKSKVSKRSMN